MIVFVFRQKDKQRRTLLVLAILLLGFGTVTGQQIVPASFFQKGNTTFTWEENRMVQVPNLPNRHWDAPAVKGCTYDNQLHNLPMKMYWVRVPEGQELTVQRADGLYTEATDNTFRQAVQVYEQGDFSAADWYPASPVVVSKPFYHRKQRYQRVFFYPVQVHSSGTRYRKYTRLNYSPGLKAAPAQKTAGTATAANSVLANGQWHKLAVTQDGVYRLERSDLEDLGIDAASLNPQNLRLFHNGGGRLPQNNADFRYDDLAENPCYVVGGEDGSFDNGDQLIFFAEGPDSWRYDVTQDRFSHDQNIYTDTNYVFLNVGSTAGLRIQEATPQSGGAMMESVLQPAVYHEDKHNLLGMGRHWFGDEFDAITQGTYQLNLPNIVPGSSVEIRVGMAARSGATSSFDFSEGGTQLGSVSLSAVNLNVYTSTYAQITKRDFILPGNAPALADGRLDLSVTYNKSVNSIGWLDFITVNYRRQLQLARDVEVFYATPGSQQITTQQIQLFNAAGYEVWDVTDVAEIKRIPLTDQGNGAYSFTTPVPNNNYRKFVAVRTAAYGSLPKPNRVGPVQNQNLHALAQADYVIVTHPDFKAAADRLADFHRNTNGLSVHVVNVFDIYNEFGGGKPDITAIRDFLKMFYDRGNPGDPDFLKYVLFVANATYDYKQYEHQGAFIPNYQARVSTIPPSSFGADDYYAFLDDGEGFWGERASYFPEDTQVDTHTMDIAVGRLPVATPGEANAMVDKIIDYQTHPDRFGEWRNLGVFAADYKPGESVHMQQADALTNLIRARYNCMQFRKLYIASYPTVTLAQGERYPEAKSDFLQMLDKGSLLVNYTGHGGEVGLSNAEILEIPDVNRMSNNNRYQFWVTATCEFGRYDDPGRRSAGELVFLRENGGAIGMVTSVRQVYVSGNYLINRTFYENLFTPDSITGQLPPPAVAYMQAKNISFSSAAINSRCFTFLGDPAMELAFPENEAVITAINGTPVDTNYTDTLKALSNVTVTGEVRDDNGNKLTNFSGEVVIKVLDKPLPLTTLKGNFSYNYQRVVLFNGLASVNNGEFSLDFVLPKDINYQVGNGLIVAYASSPTTDCIGCTREPVICCTDTNASENEEPPVVDVFINDRNWIDGGMTNQNPMLIADCRDDQGINTTGLGVGRNLTGILNEDQQDPYILNDFYQAKRDQSNEGTIEYQLRDLQPGEYTIDVKVWDVTNNPGVGTTTFVVADDAEMALDHILNYPNPFTTRTRFFFEHNRVGEELQVQIRIYTVSGKMVKSLRSSFVADGNLVNHIEWDGLDEFGDRIGRGVYVYELKVHAPRTGETVSEFEKLVLLR